MTYCFYLPTFAPNLAEYLQNNFIGRLHTDIAASKDILSVKVYVYDPSFNDELKIGEFIAHFIDNKKVKQEFKGHSFLLDAIHLLYEEDKRKDSHTDIPFP